MAANFVGRLTAAFGTNGVMTNYNGTNAITSPTNAQKDAYFKLSLYIGQYAAPVFKTTPDGVCADTTLAMKVTTGVQASQNVFPCLKADGTGGVAQDSGGLVISGTTATVVATQNAGSAGGVSTLSYDVAYTSAAGVAGSSPYTLEVKNPTGSAFKTVPITVYGVSSGNITGAVGVTYSAGSPMYTITSNDPLAGSYSASVVSPSPGALTTLGASLAVNASTGKITGTLTAAPGTYTIRLSTVTNASTVGANAGTATKDVSLTVAGITSSNAVSYAQDAPIATYQITSAPAASASSYTLSSTPPGLSFSTSNGQLTGTPTTSGVYALTVGASAGGTAVSQALQLTVNSAGLPTISTNLPASPTVAGTVNTAVDASSYQINVSRPSLTGMVWGATGLPVGLSVNATGQIVGTPNQSGDFLLSLTGSNATGAGTPLAWTIRINPNAAPVVSGATPVSSNANQPFAGYQIIASNQPILNNGYSATGLPPGLTLNQNTGAISGTPTTSGLFSVTLSASNVVGPSNNFVVPFTIVPTTVPSVTSTPSLAASPSVTGTVGSNITPIQINATNPPISSNGYSATGLPGGLTLIANTGLISGAPTQSGDFAVVLKAANASGTGSSASVTIRINPNAAPVVSGATPVSSNANQPFAGYQIIASNQPILNNGYSATGLPPGLTLNQNTGAISGTPTTSGLFSVTLSASNVVGPSNNFVVPFTIVPTTVPTVTSTPSLAASPSVTGTVGSNITPIQINATNPPISSNGYSATGLPGGLALDANSGLISGAPTQSGDFAVVLKAANASGTGSSASVTIRINPNTVPVVNSANAATGAVNTAFGAYQITASNAPITSYAVLAPSVLPPGLTLSTATGAISGIPTISGSFTTNISATNVAGTSAPFAVAFTINPSTTPGITSPTFVGVAAGIALSPIQVVATNPPILANGYAASGLPPGLAMDAGSGVISGTPTTPGTFQVTLTASNLVGPGSRVVPFTIGIPAPSACAMSVALNTATTMDLASCLFNGFAPTGVSIVSTAGHGSAVANGTKVTYTPVHNYFGADSFSFVASGTGGTSPQGVVTVTVTGRPDPMQDAAVPAVITAQAEAAQRFSRAQISNFQRRMESLHRAPGVSGEAAGGGAFQGRPGTAAPAGFAAGANVAASATLPSPTSQTSAQIQNSNAVGAALALPRSIGSATVPGGIAVVDQLDQTAKVASQSDVIHAIATGTGFKSLPFAESVVSLIRSRSLDLAGVASSAGLNGAAPASGAMSYWVEGVASFGTRDANASSASSEFSSDGLTFGVDRRFSDQFAAGIGLGYARGKDNIGTDGTINRSRGYALSVYGSYQPGPNTFVDGLLGVGTLSFDTRRYVAPINDYALGQRGGTQWFGSLTGGYEFHNGNLLLSPYGRLDFSTDHLRASTESGAGSYALTFFDQTTTSLQGSLGARAESVHETSFGFVVPRVRAEYRHEFRGNGQAFVGYADQPGGPRYALPSSDQGRDGIVLGVGSDFLLRDGLTLSMEYQLSHSFANASTYAIRLRLSKDFDVRGLPKLRLAQPQADDDEANIQFDAGYNFDDNVTRAKTGPDRLLDDSYNFNLSKGFTIGLSDRSRILLTGTLGGEKFHRFNGLTRALGSLEGEYQFRNSSEFDEPTFGAFTKLTVEQFESNLRDGYRLTAGVSVSQPLTDRINVFAALSHNLRNAKSSVFSTRDYSLRGNLDYAVNDRQTLYMGAEYRRGDFVSTGQASLENVTIAKVFAQDDAFPGGRLFSYRVDGSTVLWTLGYNVNLGNRDSIDLSWRHVRSTPGLRPSFVTSPKSYIDNQLSMLYLMRF